MKVFVSYAREDRKPAEAIAVRLQQEDHEVYFDRSSLRPGEGYDEALREFIDKADLLVFLISPDSITNGRYTLSELKFASQRWPNPNGRVLPVMARKTPMDEIPSFLQAIGILEAEGNLVAEVIAEVDRIHGRRLRKRVLGGAAIAACAAVVAVAVVFLTPDPPPPDLSGVSEETSTIAETDHQVTQPDPQILEVDAEPCGDLRILKDCEIELARNICRAYTALENGDIESLAAGNELLVSRAGSFLYTKSAENQAATQFLENVTHAYQASGGRDVRLAEFGDPRLFWRETTDASLVLSAVINSSENEIPDGESSIYYGEDVPLSIPFRVEGRQWGKTRNIHVAAFAYYSAISSTDADSARNWLDLAVTRMTDVCRQ
jgi:hypothetical protein